jgi:cyanophycinase
VRKLDAIFFCFVSLLISGNVSDSCCAQSMISIGISGDTLDVKTPTQSGTLLMGGSTDVDAAIQWMINKSGGGDFVIIRASGSTGYNDYIKGLGNVNSVETLLIDSREKANLAEAGEKIRNAEALFIAGGDQSNYVNFWADTEVSKAIRYLIEKKKVPIGGTSAGCAILSDFIFDAKKGGVNSEEALANPYDSLVSVSKTFIPIPVLKNVIADQHYSKRTRQGRHLVFMARLIKDFNVFTLGIGVDEKTAVAVEDNGATKIFGSGAAHFLVANGVPEQCETGKKLIWNRDGKAIGAYIKNGSAAGTEGINVLQIPTSTPDQYWRVVAGELRMD